MSTRRVNDSRFNHGCQLIPSKSEKFQSFCSKVIQERVVKKLSDNVVNNIKLEIEKVNYKSKHYIPIPYMNNLCKYSAKDLAIHLNTRIIKIERIHSQWMLYSEKKFFESFDM